MADSESKSESPRIETGSEAKRPRARTFLQGGCGSLLLVFVGIGMIVRCASGPDLESDALAMASDIYRDTFRVQPEAVVWLGSSERSDAEKRHLARILVDAAMKNPQTDLPAAWSRTETARLSLRNATVEALLALGGAQLDTRKATAGTPSDPVRERMRQVLAAIDKPHNVLDYQIAPSLIKYDISEQWALLALGDPVVEWRDGTGGHYYAWTGNGTAIVAEFRNGRCWDFSILDAEDIRIMLGE